MALKSLWMLLATFFFALVALFTKMASDYYNVWEIIFFRSLFGVALCLTVLKKKHVSLATRHPWRHVVRCAIGTGCITLGVYVLSILPLGTAQTFAYTGPLWFCLFLAAAARLSGERLEKPLLAAVAAGFAGVLLILRPDFPGSALTGALLGVLVGCLGGAADFMIRDLSRHQEPPERIVFYFTLCGTATGLAGSLATGFSPHAAEGVALLLGIGAAATAAQLSLTTGWTYGHPLLNSVYQFAGIPFAVILGFFVFGERLDAVTLGGIIVVTGAGITATVLRLTAEKRRAAEDGAAGLKTIPTDPIHE